MKYTLSVQTKHGEDVATLTTLAAMIHMNRKMEEATLGQLLFEDYTTLCDPVQAVFAVTEIITAATNLFYEEDENGVPSPIFLRRQKVVIHRPKPRKRNEGPRNPSGRGCDGVTFFAKIQPTFSKSSTLA